jgi:putative ABC transport system permease protein
MILNKRIKRNIKGNISFHVSAFLLTAISVSLLVILTTVGYMIKISVSSIMESNNVEDAEFATTELINNEKISWMEEEFNIFLERMRYVDVDSDNYTLRVFSETEKINTYELLEGEPLSSDREILISRDFSLAHDIQIGDSIEINDNSHTVVGIAVRPDYLHALKDTSDVGLEKEKFGVAIVLSSVLDEIGDENNYYAIKYNEANDTTIRKFISSEFNPTSYTSAAANRRINNPRTMGDEILSNTSVIIPVMFIMVMAIIAIVIGRMAKKEQKQIGTLSALGYKKRELCFHYVNFAVFPAITGAIFGVLFSLIILKPACLYFANNLEQLNYNITPPLFIIVLSFLIPAVLYGMTAYLTVKRLLKKNTAILLSGNASVKTKIRKIFVNSKMKFQSKFQLRSLMKNKIRSLAVLIGLLIGSVLILTGFIALDSTNTMIDTRIDSSGDYEYEYFLNTMESDNLITGEKALSYRFEVEGYNSLLMMVGIRENSKYPVLKCKSGQPIEYGNYYISNVGAEYYGISAGDELTLYHPLTLESVTITIADIIDDNSRGILYTSTENVAEILNVSEKSYNTILTDNELNIPEEKIIMFSSKGIIKEQMKQLLSTVYSLLGMILFFGVLLSMITTYLIVNMLVEENKNNISMLKVLGYRPKEINKLVLNTNHILLPIGFIISIPFSQQLAAAIFRGNIESMGNYIEPVVSAWSVLLSFIILCVSYFLSLFFLKRKVYKVDMVESLKDNRE